MLAKVLDLKEGNSVHLVVPFPVLIVFGMVVEWMAMVEFGVGIGIGVGGCCLCRGCL